MSKLEFSTTIDTKDIIRGNDTMRTMNLTTLNDYAWELKEQEKAPGTIEKYLRDIRHFYEWLGADKSVNKTRVMRYKEHLKEAFDDNVNGIPRANA